MKKIRKIKIVKIGDYVLATKYGDKDPYDPWHVGCITEYGVDKKGVFYKVEQDERHYRNVFKITKEEGDQWMRLYSHT